MEVINCKNVEIDAYNYILIIFKGNHIYLAIDDIKDFLDKLTQTMKKHSGPFIFFLQTLATYRVMESY